MFEERFSGSVQANKGRFSSFGEVNMAVTRPPVLVPAMKSNSNLEFGFKEGEDCRWDNASHSPTINAENCGELLSL
ncbi:hypothetical protein QQP08_017489 [Theobroma cacao]|nr:hypothetical protein QQP08_017489 [Theobroma cacao]